jgi:hypothetical protein
VKRPGKGAGTIAGVGVRSGHDDQFLLYVWIGRIALVAVEIALRDVRLVTVAGDEVMDVLRPATVRHRQNRVECVGAVVAGPELAAHVERTAVPVVVAFGVDLPDVEDRSRKRFARRGVGDVAAHRQRRARFIRLA